jgi:hypothetical protein
LLAVVAVVVVFLTQLVQERLVAAAVAVHLLHIIQPHHCPARNPIQ